MIMTGVCRGKGFNVGFGSVEGVVLPAVPLISLICRLDFFI